MENRDMNLFDFILLCCKALGRFFKWSGCVVLQLLRLSLQYIWVLLPCVVLGVLMGWLWAKPFATTFKGNATIMYAEGMREVVQEGIVEFFTLPESVKCEYGLTKELLDAFEQLDSYNVIDCNFDSVADFVDRNRKVDLSDTTNVVMRDRIHLELKMNGLNDFKPFENAIVKYFNEQDYLLKAHEACKAIQKERLDYFAKEVARLDSFSTYDYFVRPRSLVMEQHNGFIIGSKQSLYYDAIMVVLKHKNYLEMQYRATPEVINFQTPFVVYVLPPIYKYAIGLVLGLILGLMLALFIKYKTVTVAYLREK